MSSKTYRVDIKTRKPVNNKAKVTIKAGSPKSAVPKTKTQLPKKKIPRATTVLQREKSAVSNLDAVVVTTPTQLPISVDTVSYQHFIECVLVDYVKRTDLAFTGAPLYWAYYFWFLFFMHIKRVGTLTGEIASALPTQVNALDYATPFAIAKYLEYLSPNSEGCSVVTTSPSDIFQNPPNSSFGLIPGTGIFPRDEGNNALPSWWILLGCTDPEVQMPDDSFVRSAGTYFYGYDENDTKLPLSFLEWVSDLSNPQLYSSYAQKRDSNTVPIGRIALKSPDQTAYARCSVPPGANQTNFTGGVFGPTRRFVAELVPMFSIQAQNVGQYSSVTSKSMVGPIQANPAPNMPYYTQLAFVFIFLANQMRTYRPGTIYSVAVGGKHLRTLFPQFHQINGMALGQAVQKTYEAIISAKGISDNVDFANNVWDKHYYFLTNLNACAYFALQRKLNLTEVVHCCDPITTSPSTTFSQVLSPQITYADSSWGTNKLPLLIAKIVDEVGVTVTDGILRVPQTNYRGKITAREPSNSQLGPFQWSVNGYLGQEDDYFGVPNLYSGPWYPSGTYNPGYIPGINVAQGVGSTGVIVACSWDASFASAYYGWVGASTATGTLEAGPALNPIVANGTAANTIQTNYKTALSWKQNTNIIPLVAPRPGIFGNSVVMNSSVVYAKEGGSITNVSQYGVVNQTIQDQTDDNILKAAFPSIDSVGSSLPLSSGDLFDAVVGTAEDQEAATSYNYNSPTYHATVFKRKRALINFETTTENPAVPVAMPHSVNPPDSGGSQDALSSVSQSFCAPNSTVASTIQNAITKMAPLGSEAMPPLTAILKNHLAPAAGQYSDGIHGRNDPFGYYGARQNVVSSDIKTPSTKGNHHPVAAVVGGMYKAATGVTKVIGKGEKSIVALLGKDL